MAKKKNDSNDMELTLDEELLDLLTTPVEVWGEELFTELKDLINNFHGIFRDLLITTARKLEFQHYQAKYRRLNISEWKKGDKAVLCEGTLTIRNKKHNHDIIIKAPLFHEKATVNVSEDLFSYICLIIVLSRGTHFDGAYLSQYLGIPYKEVPIAYFDYKQKK